MPCKEQDFNPGESVNMQTWSGMDASGTPQQVCSIDGTKVVRHCVLVENHDTIQKTFHVHGIIAARPNSARFSGYVARSETLWSDEITIDGFNHFGTSYRRLFDSIEIEKKVSGSETLLVNVYYEDPWKNNTLIRADRPLICPLTFDVTLI